MRTLIDWLSFTVPIGNGNYPERGWQWLDIQQFINSYVGEIVSQFFSGVSWLLDKGRAPFGQSFKSERGGLTVFFSSRLPYALIEISGVGMQQFREAGIEKALLEIAAERVTRIDIASDIRTQASPADFASKRDLGRFKSNASFRSKTGDTEYVGGRTSERYARVYRYAEPHPRAEFLRVEHELKKSAAKVAIAHILGNGVSWVQASLGRTFGWTHPAWSMDETDAYAMPSIPNSRTAAKTELWLRTQAAPAFVKLVKQGLIDDPEKWLRDVFLSELHPNAE